MSLELKTITHFVSQFYHTELPESVSYSVLRDSLSDGQIYSKMQIIKLMQELNMHSKKCLFLAHWHGFLPLLLKNFGLIEAGRGFEMDQRWVNFSNRMNSDWDWKSEHKNIFEINYTDLANFNDFDLLINTSCEHMNPEWLNKVPAGKKLILQSTDYIHKEHVNRVESLEEFISSLPRNFKVIKSEVLNCKVYNRFTILSVKS